MHFFKTVKYKLCTKDVAFLKHKKKDNVQIKKKQKYCKNEFEKTIKNSLPPFSGRRKDLNW
jgi:hypothetical protein